MSSVSSSNNERSVDGKLPVFVFPTSLNFYVDDPRSRKQVLTLYNPYDFPVEFKVLSNNPANYDVVESKGKIKEKCCVEIVIRTIHFHFDYRKRYDKFRIELFEYGGFSKPIGNKDVNAYVLPTNEEERKGTSSSGRRASIQEADEAFLRQRKESVVIQRTLPSVPVILVLLCCIVALMLPTRGEGSSSIIPLYLHLSMNLKLVVCYVLGLVTMAILKT